MFSYVPQTKGLDQQFYRLIIKLIPSEASAPVTVIGIDDQTEKKFGARPWSRKRLALAIDLLNKKQVNTIGLLSPLDYREEADTRLIHNMRKGKNVVIAAHSKNYNVAQDQGSLSNRYLITSYQAGFNKIVYPFITFSNRNHASPALPLRQFSKVAGGVGVLNFPKNERVVSEQLVYHIGPGLVPTFPLAIAARFFDLEVPAIRFAQSKLNLGNITANLDINDRYYPRIWRQTPYKFYSINQLFNNSIPKSDIENRIVLLGEGANAVELLGPGGENLTPLSWTAYVVSSLVKQTNVYLPEWYYGVERMLIVLLALIIFFTPRRFHGYSGLIMAAVIVVVFVNIQIVFMFSSHIWLPLVLPAVFLMISQTIMSSHHRMSRDLFLAISRGNEARQELADNFQNQGRLDQAFQELCKCTRHKGLVEPFYQLGIDFERRRQMSKAIAAYEQIQQISPKYKDITVRLRKLKAIPESIPSGANSGPGSTMVATMVVNRPDGEKPMLGRYKIDKELGKGAMGVVYLGQDPKIGRQVAIKTLSLMDEFGEEQFDDAKARFYREAEAVGRLQHPNIITVYDVGEEHDLAYIAMDYAPGVSLDNHSREDNLLHSDTVLEICVKVARGLSYAHKNDIVHRDIKPGNIIYDEKTDGVKITDFGIAHMSDSSKTTSGVILGSPSYMSPEQVVGKKLDGRSDLYSLGVMMFQLLTGHLPFVGDSVTNLMYKITNSKPESINKYITGLPPCVNRIISKALQKQPDKRYKSGNDMADAIEECLKRF